MAPGASSELLGLEPVQIVAEAVVAATLAQQSALLPVDDGLGVLQALADRLAELGSTEGCPRELSRAVLACRDRLASHVHAARTLGEVEVGVDVTQDLLRRGLAEAAAQIARLQAPPSASGS